MNNYHWVKAVTAIDRAISIMIRLRKWSILAKIVGAEDIFIDIDKFLDDYTPLTEEQIAEKRKKFSEIKF